MGCTHRSFVSGEGNTFSSWGLSIPVFQAKDSFLPPFKFSMGISPPPHALYEVPLTTIPSYMKTVFVINITKNVSEHN
jgi:hypothetical protein